MKIAILTLGTRGDVQPYAVLGRALKQRGHEVTLATAKNYEQLVKSYDIDFSPVEADFQELLESDDGKKMMKGNPFAIKRKLKSWLYPYITNSLITFYNLSNNSDLVLYHVKTLADSFADQFPEKMIRASVLPIIEPTNDFANPAFSGLPIPGFLNRWTYLFTNFSIKLLSIPILEFRKKCNLPPKFTIPPVKNIYGLSSLFLPVPQDYPGNSVFTGFWFGRAKEELTEGVKEFLRAGKPPVVLTFGSMPLNSKFDLQSAILTLVEKHNIRMIVLKGWGLNQTKDLEDNPNILVIESAPYEKLFPLVKAIIHHGGIGTTAECLHAGKPFMICPILYPIGDQLFWGKLAFKKNLAAKPVPLSKMTKSVFLAAVLDLISDEERYKSAQQMQVLINSEDGIENTIQYLGLA